MTIDINTEIADLTRRAKSVSLNINPHATGPVVMTASEYVGEATAAASRIAALAQRLGRASLQAAVAQARANVFVEIASAVDDARTLYSLSVMHGEKTAIFYGSDLAAVMAAARARLDTYEAELPKLVDMVKT